MIDVVAAILENKNGELLIAKRKKGKKLAGYWEFPGGKVEKGETPRQTLVRELNEEMNIEIETGEFIGENIHHYDPESTIRLLAYKGIITKGEIELMDHEQYRWVNIKDLKNIRLAPADISFAALLNKNMP